MIVPHICFFQAGRLALAENIIAANGRYIAHEGAGPAPGIHRFSFGIDNLRVNRFNRSGTNDEKAF